MEGDIVGTELETYHRRRWSMLRRYGSERTAAVGAPCWVKDTPKRLWLWATHAGVGTPQRDCGLSKP